MRFCPVFESHGVDTCPVGANGVPGARTLRSLIRGDYVSSTKYDTHPVTPHPERGACLKEANFG